MAKTIQEAQDDVRNFARRNKWEDRPNVAKHQDIFTAEMGDLLFGVCRLANQLGVDLEEAFRMTHEKALKKYQGGAAENNIPWKTQ